MIPEKSVVTRFALKAAALGLVLPISIFAVSEARLITGTWWFNSIPFVWPSYLMLLPFSGPLDLMTIGVLVVSMFVNALIYAAIGALLFVLFQRSRRVSTAHPSQGDG